MVPSLSRRSLLAGTGVGFATLAGCASLGGFGGCSGGYTMDVNRLDDADLPERIVETPRGEDAGIARELIRSAATDGSATYTTYHGPPLRAGIYVRHDGTYYRTRRELAESRELTAESLYIEYDRERTPPSDATVVAWSDLPAADRRALSEGIGNDEVRATELRAFSIRGYPHRYPDDAESRLRDGRPVWVRDEDGRGRLYRVEIRGPRTVEEETFRYELDGSPETPRPSWRSSGRRSWSPSTSAKSRPSRSRVPSGGRYLSEPLPEAFAGVVEELEAVPGARRPSTQEFLVEQDGTTSWVELLRFVA